MNKSRTPWPASSAYKAAAVSRRVLIAVPPQGFGAQLSAMGCWLNEVCGRDGWASAPAGTGGVVNDAIAFYFADPKHASAFVRRFCCAYRGLSSAPGG